MLFNSYSFFLFASAFFVCWRYTRWPIPTLVSFSLIFYAAWNPYFILLLLFTSTTDYFSALLIERDRRHAKLYLVVSITMNLAVLGFFKYFNFMQSAVEQAAGIAGFSWNATTIDVVLPVGISFYTFQAIAYTVDVYRGQLAAERHFGQYLCYISLFPQLLAGPIERANRILPQIRRIAAGVRPAVDWPDATALMLRGFIKKVVIADNLAPYVDQIFADPSGYRLATIGVATLFFAVQIYCDFSGYTDIARGLARLMGINLVENFNRPYAATSPRDFWRRWHISLSTWLRDYLYIPLGGGRHGGWTTTRNLMITMTLGGLWHGAAYNFILWGLYHGALLSIWRGVSDSAPPLTRLASWALTMVAVLFGWYLFRIGSVADIGVLFGKITGPATGRQVLPAIREILVFFSFVGLTAVENLRQQRLEISARPWQIAALLVVIYALMPPVDQPFIYFQF